MICSYCINQFSIYRVRVQVCYLQCVLDAFILVNRWILCDSSLETQILLPQITAKIRSSTLTC